MSDAQTVLAYTLFNAVYAASAYPLGALSERVGRWGMIRAGWAVYALVYFGFALADARAVWWLFPLYGLFMGCTDGVGRAVIRDHSPEERKGSARGVFHMAIGGAFLAGSVAAGVLWDRIGPEAPFALGGIVAVAAVVGTLRLRSGSRGASG